MAKPERIESVGVRLTLRGDVYNSVLDLVRDAGVKDVRVVEERDVVYVTYDFWIEYYGVVKQLTALIELMDNPQVFSAAMGERSDQNILIADFIDKLRQLQLKLAVA